MKSNAPKGDGNVSATDYPPGKFSGDSSAEHWDGGGDRRLWRFADDYGDAGGDGMGGGRSHAWAPWGT